MNKDEFTQTAIRGGYATRPTVRSYVAINGEREYTDDDLIEVSRFDKHRYDIVNYQYLTGKKYGKRARG